MNASIDDETLMAYADEQLTGDERAKVEAAMRSNPELAERVIEHRALRAKLQSSFASVLGEPIPDRLRSLVAGRQVVELGQGRKARDARQERRILPSRWLSLAASLFVGIAIGRIALDSDDTQGVVADAELGRALSAGGGGDAQAAVLIGMSYLSKSGNYCRAFADARLGANGVACREGDDWRIRVLVPTEPAAGEYRTAGSALPQAIAEHIESDMVGGPLDAQAETEAANRGWLVRP